MHPSTARKRQHLLQQMEQIEHMETGALTEEFRSRLIDGVEVSLGPYFKHQQWQAGRNCSRRVPPDEAAPLRAAIEGRQRFEELSAQEFVDLTVAATREEASAPQSKKNSRRKSGRRSSRKPPPS